METWRSSKDVLVARWTAIQESCESVDSEKQATMQEDWFEDAFKFLRGLPPDQHCWCGHREIALPLLEPFYHYDTMLAEAEEEGATGGESTLSGLWKHMKRDMASCINCVCAHHEAKKHYEREYEEEVVQPMLGILKRLDEERVEGQLRRLRGGLGAGDEGDAAQLVCVIFEVLMFPELLEDAAVQSLFAPVLRHVAENYDLTFEARQRYPGLYALLLHKEQSVRSIAFKQAQLLGKFRTAADLQPIQPLIQMCISFFEAEEATNPKPRTTAKPVQTLQESWAKGGCASGAVGGEGGKERARTEPRKEEVWLGMQTILSFLAPPAFEEGVVERYPSFVAIVLNHVSEDSSVFRPALNCLRMLLEVLGYQLWVHSSLTPSVIRQTLVTRCFHSSKEAMHKLVFDLLPPYLRSLEALDESGLGAERWMLLHFLLHQVPASRNFSPATAKMARQIAFNVVIRGYCLDPPAPPLDCVHVWGPPLIATVSDSTLVTPLRQPALNLIHLILACDTSALLTLIAAPVRYCPPPLPDEDQLVAPVSGGPLPRWQVGKAADVAAGDADTWQSAPAIWTELFFRTPPPLLPETVGKAAVWVAGQLAVLEEPPLAEWGLGGGGAGAVEGVLGRAVVWADPDGYNAFKGGGGVNSVGMRGCVGEFQKLLQRCVAVYLAGLRVGEMYKQWEWEEWVAGPAFGLALHVNSIARDISREMVAHFSGGEWLQDSQLAFLGSSLQSASAVGRAVGEASSVLAGLPVARSALHLHLLLHYAHKIMSPSATSAPTLARAAATAHLVLPGGFLKDPKLPPRGGQGTGVTSDQADRRRENQRKGAIWQHLCRQVARGLWPLAVKLLKWGRVHSDSSAYQNALTRLFGLLPILRRYLANMEEGMEGTVGGEWVADLLRWGRVEEVWVRQAWAPAVIAMCAEMRREGGEFSGEATAVVEELVMPGSTLSDQDRLDLSASFRSARLPGSLGLDPLANLPTRAVPPLPTQADSASVEFFDLSDDEGEEVAKEEEEEEEGVGVEGREMDADFRARLGLKPRTQEGNEGGKEGGEGKESSTASVFRPSQDPGSRAFAHVGVKKHAAATLDRYLKSQVAPQKLPPPHSGGTGKFGYLPGIGQAGSRGQSHGVKGTGQKKGGGGLLSDLKAAHRKEVEQRVDVQAGVRRQVEDRRKVPGKGESAVGQAEAEERGKQRLRELVSDDDSLEQALDSVRRREVEGGGAKAGGGSKPVRKLISLSMPDEMLRGGMGARVGKAKGRGARPPLPKVDVWYRQVLGLDYFEAVSGKRGGEGLAPVPTVFESAERYMDVFRPLLFEEFKAQLVKGQEEVGGRGAVLRLMSLERVDDFWKGRFVAEGGGEGVVGMWGEMDLLLLSKQPFVGAQNSTHLLGKVERRERDSNRLPLIQVTLFLPPTDIRLAKAKTQLIERSKWHATRVLNLIPQHREAQAMASLRHLPLLRTLLGGGGAEGGSTGQMRKNLEALPAGLGRQLAQDYNEGQLAAIGAAVGKRRGEGEEGDHQLALIQGPPGTGKTRTIVAIVSAMLAMRHKSAAGGEDTWNAHLPKGSDVSDRGARGSGGGGQVSAAQVSMSWQAAAVAKDMMKKEEEVQKKKEKDARVQEALGGGGWRRPGGGGGGRRGRVLVCAQSNAAVDEMVARIAEPGLYGVDGEFYRAALVRVGNKSTVHPDSLPFHIDTLVDAIMGVEVEEVEAEGGGGGQAKARERKKELERCMGLIQTIEALRAQQGGVTAVDGENGANGANGSGGAGGGGGQEGGDLEREAAVVVKGGESAVRSHLNVLYRKKRDICAELAGLHREGRKRSEEDRALRAAMRRKLLREAEVVAATLSGWEGGGEGKGEGWFDAVVIDEAGQALEAATLIPMQLLADVNARCVLVGDPNQLPATVLSQSAARLGFERSMFERLQQGGSLLTLLTVQYRMHPHIRHFPSLHFYHGRLTDGTGVNVHTRAAPFHAHPLLTPYRFFDVGEGVERRGGTSLTNEAEAEVALELVRGLWKRYPEEVAPGRIGVITPYKQQLHLLKARFAQGLGSERSARIEMNTVDGFQGREVDILIFSTVRATGGGIGFVADVRRMNVALTRAKLSLWIVGNQQTLRGGGSAAWAALIGDAEARGCVTAVHRPYDAVLDRAPLTAPPVAYQLEEKEVGREERDGKGGVQPHGGGVRRARSVRSRGGKERDAAGGVVGAGGCIREPGVDNREENGVSGGGGAVKGGGVGMGGEQLSMEELLAKAKRSLAEKRAAEAKAGQDEGGKREGGRRGDNASEWGQEEGQRPAKKARGEGDGRVGKRGIVVLVEGESESLKGERGHSRRGKAEVKGVVGERRDERGGGGGKDMEKERVRREGEERGGHARDKDGRGGDKVKVKARDGGGSRDMGGGRDGGDGKRREEGRKSEGGSKKGKDPIQGEARRDEKNRDVHVRVEPKPMFIATSKTREQELMEKKRRREEAMAALGGGLRTNHSQKSEIFKTSRETNERRGVATLDVGPREGGSRSRRVVGGMTKSGGACLGGEAKGVSKGRERERGGGKGEAEIDAVLDQAWKEANAAKADIGHGEHQGKENRSDHFGRFEHRQRR